MRFGRQGVAALAAIAMNADDDFEPDDEGQVLLGFRVPKGTKVPKRIRPRTVTFIEHFSPPRGDAPPDILFTRYSDYQRELNEVAPHSDRYRYFGFSSNQLTMPNAVAKIRFKVRMRVPKRLVGHKFKVRPVVGYLQQPPEGTPVVDCGDDAFEEHGGLGYWSHCIDSPSRSNFKNLKVRIKPRR